MRGRGSRFFCRPINAICVSLVLVAALQVALDIRRTALIFNESRARIKQPDTFDESVSRLPMSNISIEDYIRSYTLPKHMRACVSLRRPAEASIFKHKGVYQRFDLTPNGYPTTDVYFLAFYLDERFLSTGARYIRTFVTLRGIGPERQASKETIHKTAVWSWQVNDTPTHVLLWYDGFADPLTSQCSTRPAFGITRNVSGVFFYEHVITCALPDIDVLPTHVSIAQHACRTASNYVALTRPRAPRSLATRDIGVCMASLYGTMTSADVPYFVSWMEALRLYGVSEVNMNNALMTLDNITRDVIDYYRATGQLHYSEYPVIHSRWRETEADAATESTNRMHVAHCFMRNVRRYWQTLVIDLDELPVPTHTDTYTDAINTIHRRNATLSDAHCLTMRSAFFYLDLDVGNASFGEHLPLHRYTRRFRSEPVQLGHHDGLGLGKSLHNPRRVVAMGHHLCRSSHVELGVELLKHSFVDESDLLIHHYRKTCKYTPDCRNATRIVQDDTVPRAIGSQLRSRVERILKAVNFPFKQ